MDCQALLTRNGFTKVSASGSYGADGGAGGYSGNGGDGGRSGTSGQEVGLEAVEPRVRVLVVAVV
jgi:hypothetical protein